MRSGSLLLSFLIIPFLLSCGGSGGGGVGVTMYASQCQEACMPVSGSPCAGKSATECAADCTTQTAGVSLQCAVCLLKYTGWSTTSCVCDMNGCKTCGKSPGYPNQPCTGGPDFMCDPGTVCSGYRVGTPSDCKSECAAASSDEPAR